MDDRDLDLLRREPSPEFASALRRRLRATESETAAPRRRFPLTAVIAAAVVVAVVASFAFSPSVRASAQAFLDLFRVRQFTAVSFDPSRFERFKQQNEDNPMLAFARTEKLEDPGPPRGFADLGSATPAAGFLAAKPGYVPAGYAADSVWVTGHGAARLTIDVKKLRDVLSALDIRDVTVPDAYDGKSATVTMTPVVLQRFKKGDQRVLVTEAASPAVEVPADVDLQRLGAIGLRILGASPFDAERLAHSIDWKSTMLVPVPNDAGSFREVTVHGVKGLMVTMMGGSKEGRRRQGAVVLWTEGDHVHAVQGPVDREELLQMAESVR
ncbi:MAG TPA: hypothetical protein VLV15_03615 [Dongiaceae bacterium]|nr:hypothetical protein [Dongiaceae bacterium]